ncbi:hypothetical protein [Qipengyuania spongiae]|uniref:DUF2268 domain-containing protein n=1 Tax=Qipengyuania spongiae TaxID=2909673 RepID=A0ABY5SXY1_9SPHN|nr:hypothetical protein [Qipengyuania spongiae]UVI39402.1 hypothetical protein L1F33_00065 [Qipengyuania spongiae]
MKKISVLAFSLLLFPNVLWAEEREISPQQIEYADPLTVQVQTEDANRFARLFSETSGAPTVEQLQTRYLDPGSYGISIFTPNRIQNAENLAAKIAEHPEIYSKAIDVCLPLAKSATPELRSIYLGLHGALPNTKLPQVYFVFGANNSGGTAGPGAQVLGLEVLCRISETPDDFRKSLRHFFAHETVHVLQDDAGLSFGDDILLRSALVEGAADFIAQLVTGQNGDPAQSSWANAHGPMLWQQFAKDISITRASKEPGENGTPTNDAFFRWIGNAGETKNGWPGELGYWIGAQIWQKVYDAASDKRTVLREMLTIENPRAVLHEAEAAGLYSTQ